MNSRWNLLPNIAIAMYLAWPLFHLTIIQSEKWTQRIEDQLAKDTNQHRMAESSDFLHGLGIQQMILKDVAVIIYRLDQSIKECVGASFDIDLSAEQIRSLKEIDLSEFPYLLIEVNDVNKFEDARQEIQGHQQQVRKTIQTVVAILKDLRNKIEMTKSYDCQISIPVYFSHTEFFCHSFHETEPPFETTSYAYRGKVGVIVSNILELMEALSEQKVDFRLIGDDWHQYIPHQLELNLVDSE